MPPGLNHWPQADAIVFVHIQVIIRLSGFSETPEATWDLRRVQSLAREAPQAQGLSFLARTNGSCSIMFGRTWKD